MSAAPARHQPPIGRVRHEPAENPYVEPAGMGDYPDTGPIEAEQKAVARIVELRRAGRSCREIATALDAEGHKPRRVASWSAAAVRNVALREIAGSLKARSASRGGLRPPGSPVPTAVIPPLSWRPTPMRGRVRSRAASDAVFGRTHE